MSVRFITPLARLSYPHLDKPTVNKSAQTDAGKAPKYSTALLFDAKTDLTKLRAAIVEAATEKFGTTFKGKTIAQAIDQGLIKTPLHDDWAAKNYPEGTRYLNARSSEQPVCVYSTPDPSDPSGKKPLRIPQDKLRSDLYAGAFVLASISFFGFSNSGNTGVGVGLNNVQKRGDGERLDNHLSSEDEFDVDLSQPAPSLEDIV